jgi:hypothetical protein
VWSVNPNDMGQENYLEEVHSRVMRVTEDLRAIQRELNCAAMQAPTDPELMEALSKLPEMDSLQVLKSALDQMRHFLWFYIQVMTNESEGGEKLRQTIRQKASEDVVVSAEAALLKKCRTATDAELIRYLSEGKVRKPN